MRYLTLLLIAILVAACEPTTAAQRVTASTAIIGTAQADQYRRDANATESARLSTITAEAYRAASTQSAVTQTQVWIDQRATAQAAGAIFTQKAVSIQASYRSTAQSVTVTAEAARIGTATTQAGQQATATASVQGTQTALDLSVRASAAEREIIVNRWGVVFLAILAAVYIWALWAVMRIWARRLGFVRYGPNANPLILLPNGAVYNPLNESWSGDDVPPELRAQLAAGFQQVLAIQAQHNPFPPAKPESQKITEWRLGPASGKTAITPAPFIRPVDPALLASTPSPSAGAIAAPKEKLHMVYVQGQGVSEADRELCDLREFVERGALQGFTRQLWLGHKYQSGHDGTRERYDKLVDIATQAGVLEPSGRTWRLAVSQEQAVDALNLGNVELG